ATSVCRPRGIVERTVLAYQGRGDGELAGVAAAPIDLAAPLATGTDRPTAERVSIGVIRTSPRSLTTLSAQARHLPKRSSSKMPSLASDTPPAATPAANGSAPGISVPAPLTPSFAQILTQPALEFVAGLARAFEPRRRQLLGRRADRQRDFDARA